MPFPVEEPVPTAKTVFVLLPEVIQYCQPVRFAPLTGAADKARGPLPAGEKDPEAGRPSNDWL